MLGNHVMKGSSNLYNDDPKFLFKNHSILKNVEILKKNISCQTGPIYYKIFSVAKGLKPRV